MGKDFTKWMSEKAEGFGWDDILDCITVPTPKGAGWNSPFWKEEHYSLLLQQSVRGIVKEIGELEETEKIMVLDAFMSDEIAENYLKLRYEKEKKQ